MSSFCDIPHIGLTKNEVVAYLRAGILPHDLVERLKIVLYAPCVNCSDRRCMGCVTRVYDHDCLENQCDACDACPDDALTAEGDLNLTVLGGLDDTSDPCEFCGATVRHPANLAAHRQTYHLREDLLALQSKLATSEQTLREAGETLEQYGQHTAECVTAIAKYRAQCTCGLSREIARLTRGSTGEAGPYR